MFCVLDGKTSEKYRCISDISLNLIPVDVQKYPFSPYTNGDGLSTLALSRNGVCPELQNQRNFSLNIMQIKTSIENMKILVLKYL